MKTPADVIQALQATNSRLDKETIIQQAFDAGMLDFFLGAKMALDVMVTYGVKSVPLIEEDDGTADFTWQEFCDLANQLQTRKLTGNAARDALRQAAMRAPAHEWNFWYRRILLKDLKCGTSEKTINSVLDKNGKQGKALQVPVFSCQLAKPADDHPKKMTGAKLLDRKFDGVRLLTVVQKTGEVSQFTRNGLQNTNFGHICQMLKGLAPYLTESVVLDGEIISASFQSLMKQVNRKEDVNTQDSKLVLFDIIPLKDFQAGEYKVGQADRHAALCELIPVLDEITDGVVVVEPKLSVNLDTPEGKKKLAEFNRQVLDDKLEGIMIKDPTAPYRTKRTDAWLKMKPYLTLDLEVVAIEPGTVGSKYENTMGAVVFSGVDEGKKVYVSVGSGWSDEDRDVIWQDRERLIGYIGEIKGDALTLSQDNDTYSLRFPVFVRWRGQTHGDKI